jgi:hypothetical protein
LYSSYDVVAALQLIKTLDGRRVNDSLSLQYSTYFDGYNSRRIKMQKVDPWAGHALSCGLPEGLYMAFLEVDSPSDLIIVKAPVGLCAFDIKVVRNRTAIVRLYWDSGMGEEDPTYKWREAYDSTDRCK